MKKRIFGVICLLALCMTTIAFGESGIINRGDYNEDVIRLHQKLREFGYFTLRPESPWCEQSKEALRIVQKILGLEETGSISTQEEMKEILSVNCNSVNILKNSGNPQIGSSSYEDGVWRFASGGSGLREIVSLIDAPEDDIVEGFHIVGSKSDTGNTDIGIDQVPVVYGNEYILSCYAKGYGQIKLEHGKRPWPHEVFDVDDKWHKYSITFTIGNNDGSTREAPLTNVFFGVPLGIESDIYVCGMSLTLK